MLALLLLLLRREHALRLQPPRLRGLWIALARISHPLEWPRCEREYSNVRLHIRVALLAWHPRRARKRLSRNSDLLRLG